MPDIIALGEPMVELNRHKGTEHYAVSCGGDVSNAMVAAARSGAAAGMATAVGDDEFGRMLLAMWAREGVDAASVKVDAAAPTGIYFVAHTEAGHEFSYRRAGSAASLFGPEDLPRDAIRSAKVLHVSGISQAISTRAADAVFAAMAEARAAGVLLSYDTNIRVKLWPVPRARAVIHEAMTNIDIALPGLDDARLLVGVEDPDAVADRYLSFGARIVALKLGSQGCLIATAEQRLRIPPHRVEAVDATGAGDTFDGAFLAEYLSTGDAFRAGLYANTAAALATRGYGAVDPMPRRADVLAALQASA
ncbi:sugar kinase [Lichenibacterium ramalinae]|uniref:Sugar kinase n=1 Tax=Lichenibacterium ramalinae TaxID=2316527 RepID=A0A4Q2RCA1_9HYPH|nr:sugar kinase [Lichenibacterium ramalinae]RYB05081.1 sugar kinase [Lichenibacterium ramalinae]